MSPLRKSMEPRTRSHGSRDRGFVPVHLGVPEQALEVAELAVVVEQNPAALASPQVKVFFSTKAQMPVPTELVDLNHPGCSERITGRESNAVWKFKHLDELWAGADVLDKARRAGSQKA